ncbi:MAG: hypothetical protein V3V29_10165 [Acidimicrobiia bacterium]
MQRFSITTLVLAVAMALVIALPAGAKKPDKPDKPNTGFKPMACQVDVPFVIADVRNAEGTIHVWADVNGVFTLTAEELGGFNETRYTVRPAIYSATDVLCVEVTLVDGNLSDLRVRWLDCQDCGLYRATGKDLRNFNNGDVFSAGVSVADWTDSDGPVTVAVMPKAKSTIATMTVKIGIDQ